MKLLRWFGLLLLPLALQAQGVRNPRASAEDAAAGGRIFRSHCAECHGLKGEGGRGPDLTRGQYLHGSSDEALFRTIDEGIPGTQMPGVYFEDEQIWQIVAYVRTLAAGNPRMAVRGSPKSGETLFFGKAGCSGCHMIAGRGGRFGPQLTTIGSSRTPANLRESLLHPDANLPMAWWTVEAEDSKGTKYAGLRMNEDTYSIQLLDFQKDLVSLRKADLRSLHIEDKKSHMPSYEGKLSAEELDDVISYLATLQRKPRNEQ